MSKPPAPGPARADPLRIRIERRGGLGGLKVDRSLDFLALKPAQQRAVRQIARRDPDSAATPSPGADRFSYRLQLLDADGRGEVWQLSEDDWPAALDALTGPAPD